MLKRVLVFFTTLGCVFVINKTGFSQIKLGKIVVTPYKTAVEETLNPSSVDIIYTEKLIQKGIFSLKEAIKNIPSLAYTTSGGLGGDTSVFIRGAESCHTQVMLEDIKLYDPISTTGYFYAYNYLSLAGIKKIEVLKGPYSSLYGSGGIGGTISLITQKGEGKPHFSYSQQFGSYKNFEELFISDGEIEKLAYFISLFRRDTNGFYAAKYKNGNHEKDPFHNFNGLLRLDYEFNDDIFLTFLTHYAYAKYEYDATSWTPPYLPMDDDDNYAHFYQGVEEVAFNHKVDDSFSHKIVFGYTRTYRKGWESSLSDYWYDGKTYQIKWQGNWRIKDNYKIISGFDYLREKGESVWSSTREPKRTANTKGFYSEIVMNKKNIFFSSSFRWENHSRFKDDITYSVSGSYLVEKTNTKLKASFGKGFKAPSLYQLYSSFGNPDLDPEKSESYEVGAEQKISPYLNVSLVYFHTFLSNLIEYDWVSSRYCNTGKAKIHGFEFSLDWKITPKINFQTFFTHLHTKKISTGKRLLRRPANKVTSKINFNLTKWIGELGLSYVGNRIDTSEKLKAYLLGNIALNYKLDDNKEIFLRLENILDKDYELIKGYQTPKFSGYIGMRFSF
ncbi:MAG: hypothetical protein B6D56_07755 [Candidatus Omnitrophica bacterium 4484_70.1]|nr:MAG: hypothetical protein B6D56_07755 [Candidatus Omnitrophica bacterium 4484_70.1]